MAVEAASVSTFEPVVGGLTVTVVSDDTVVAILFDGVRDDNGSRVRHVVEFPCLQGLGLLILHPIHASLSLVINRHFSCIHHCSCSTGSRLRFSCRHRFSNYIHRKIASVSLRTIQISAKAL